MTTVLKDDFMDGLIAEGLEKGMEKGLEKGSLQKARQMMLRLLDKRFSVPDDIRERIETCTDTATMDTWFDRAITATSLDEVFAELQVRTPRGNSSIEFISDRIPVAAT